MAVPTKEYIQMMRAVEDELTPEQQDIVGGWVRLEVPFHSVAALKKWRDMMKRFIATVDFYCQPREPGDPYIDEQGRLFHLRSECARINRTLRGHKGPGRPRKLRHPQPVIDVDKIKLLK